MLRIAALNTNGANGNQNYIKLLTDYNDITFINEHWIKNNEKNFFINLCKNEKIFFYSPMDQTWKKGRPWGGLCWIIKNNIKVSNFEILDDGISLIDVKINDTDLTIMGIYLSFNSNKIENSMHFLSQLKIIEGIIIRLRDQRREFLIVGDFNGDLQRSKYSNDKNLISFLKRMNLQTVENDNKEINYSYYKGNSKSLIDHAVVDINNRLNIKVIIEDSKYNTSDHLSLKMTVEVKDGKSINSNQTLNYSFSEPKIKKSYINNINWNAQIVVEEFSKLVNEELHKIKFNNAWMEDTNKQECIDRFYCQITNAFTKPHEEIIKKYYDKNCPKKTWWNKELNDYKKKLAEIRKRYKLWHEQTDYETAKGLKKEYRRLQRKCKFIYEEKKVKNIETLFKSNSKEDFWKSVQIYKNSEKGDSLEHSEEKLLIKNFTELFTQDEEMVNKDQIKKEIKNDVIEYENKTKNELNSTEKIYISHSSIKQCIKELKNSNSKGFDGLSNNMIKNVGSELIINKIKTLINAILYSGLIPKHFNRSVIIPIIKDKQKKKFDVNNYRPISVSNVFAQLLEKIILMNCPILKESSDRQYGFKEALSTYQPLFIIKEIIDKYRSQKSPLYIASLDAAKAYDSVWRDGIFYKLKNILHSQFWLVLKVYYSNSDGIFKINNKLIEESLIKITRGVKQGGILSPQLFNFYINELIEAVNKMGVGCSIDDSRISMMGYCDDLLAMSTTIHQLNKITTMCFEFGKKWLIKFNAEKSVIMNCGSKLYSDDQIVVTMGNSRMPVVEVNKYLGIKIDNLNSDDVQVVEKFKKVQNCFYSLGSFGIKPPGLNPRVKAFLYNSYCQPVGTYALGLMQIKNKTINQLNIMQNNMLRFALGIPFKTHITMLMKCLKILDIKTIYYINKCTTIKLLHRDSFTKNILVKNIRGNNVNWWLFKDIKEICELLQVDVTFVCYYPDKTRECLIENYLKINENEIEINNKINFYLNDYTYKNKKDLIKLINMTF